MEAVRHQSAPVADLAAALDTYVAWLSGLCGRAGPGPAVLGTGQRELQQVLDIRRASFPQLASQATEVLLGHAELVNLMYERQLRAGPGNGDASSTDFCAKCKGLVERQYRAIELLRGAGAQKAQGPNAVFLAPCTMREISPA
jgi:hypothetical protein